MELYPRYFVLLEKNQAERGPFVYESLSGSTTKREISKYRVNFQHMIYRIEPYIRNVLPL